MIFRKSKDEDYLGVSRKRLFNQDAFDEGLKNLESVSLEPEAQLKPEIESEPEPETELETETKLQDESVITDENTQGDSIKTETAQNETTNSQSDYGQDVSPEPEEENHHRENKMADRLILSLEDQVAFLKLQLEVKDNQLHAKDELIRNFQVLIKQDQDTILMLENRLSESRSSAEIKPVFEETEKMTSESIPKQAEVRYNSDSKHKITDTRPKAPREPKVSKAKRSFLSGWFGK